MDIDDLVNKISKKNQKNLNFFTYPIQSIINLIIVKNVYKKRTEFNKFSPLILILLIQHFPLI